MTDHDIFTLNEDPIMNIEMYSTSTCYYCDRAKKLLEDYNLSYKLIMIDEDDDMRKTMMDRSKRRTVPQIFIDDQHIGGYTDLYEYAKAGHLDK